MVELPLPDRCTLPIIYDEFARNGYKIGFYSRLIRYIEEGKINLYLDWGGWSIKANLYRIMIHDGIDRKEFENIVDAEKFFEHFEAMRTYYHETQKKNFESMDDLQRFIDQRLCGLVSQVMPNEGLEYFRNKTFSIPWLNRASWQITKVGVFNADRIIDRIKIEPPSGYVNTAKTCIIEPYEKFKITDEKIKVHISFKSLWLPIDYDPKGIDFKFSLIHDVPIELIYTTQPELETLFKNNEPSTGQQANVPTFEQLYPYFPAKRQAESAKKIIRAIKSLITELNREPDDIEIWNYLLKAHSKNVTKWLDKESISDFGQSEYYQFDNLATTLNKWRTPPLKTNNSY